jgi:hypothetical protein
MCTSVLVLKVVYVSVYEYIKVFCIVCICIYTCLCIQVLHYCIFGNRYKGRHDYVNMSNKVIMMEKVSLNEYGIVIRIMPWYFSVKITKGMQIQ